MKDFARQFNLPRFLLFFAIWFGGRTAESFWRRGEVWQEYLLLAGVYLGYVFVWNWLFRVRAK